MLQGHNQPNRLHPPERMCKDLRSMQLFAEQVLAYRAGQTPQQFRSYGFHEPNTDAGRYVYTIADDRIYYFLPKLSPDAVHRVFSHLQNLVRDQFGRNPAIQQVVIVGESSTVDDHDRLQEAVDNYQFTGTSAIAPSPEPNPMQVTLLPDATPNRLPIRRTLSYINEDPYWDPRQDELGTARDGILHDRAGAITAWLHQQPQTVSHQTVPHQTVHPSPSTTLQTPETELQRVAVADIPAIDAPIDAPAAIPYQPSNTAINRRNNATTPTDWSLSGIFSNLANNIFFLLGGIGILGTAFWLMRGGFNQPSNIATTNQLTNPVPPPPPTDNRSTTTNNNQQVATYNTRPQTAAKPAAVAAVPARQVVVATNNNQPKLPVAGFFVRSPNPYDGVNLRVGPGVNNSKIRAIPDGYWLIDEGRQIGTWREVSFQGQRGWVYRPFIR
jgi:hypothetical protein